MNQPVRIAFLGWHDRARCIVEGRDSDVEILGIVDFHRPGVDQPDEPLPRYSMARTRLADLEAGTYLVDLRPMGSPDEEAPQGTEMPGIPTRLMATV